MLSELSMELLHMGIIQPAFQVLPRIVLAPLELHRNWEVVVLCLALIVIINNS